MLYIYSIINIITFLLNLLLQRKNSHGNLVEFDHEVNIFYQK